MPLFFVDRGDSSLLDRFLTEFGFCLGNYIAAGPPQALSMCHLTSPSAFDNLCVMQEIFINFNDI
eukprot:1313969-Pyramimonas_sp.AAC.1